jgi:hypothetical protein
MIPKRPNGTPLLALQRGVMVATAVCFHSFGSCRWSSTLRDLVTLNTEVLALLDKLWPVILLKAELRLIG